MSEFYVYEHWRPDTGLPFYVGKGKGPRAFYLYSRSNHHKNIVAKQLRQGLTVEIKKVFSGLDEETAFLLEKATIAYWRGRGVKLLNITDGGEGPAGCKLTLIQRKRRSKQMKEIWSRPEVRQKARDIRADPEYKAAHSAKARAAYQDPALRMKISIAVKEARASPAERTRMSIAAKLSQSRPEVKARHRAAVKAAWARRKRQLLTSSPNSMENERAPE